MYSTVDTGWLLAFGRRGVDSWRFTYATNEPGPSSTPMRHVGRRNGVGWLEMGAEAFEDTRHANEADPCADHGGRDRGVVGRSSGALDRRLAPQQ
jgi:hypothetical protein